MQKNQTIAELNLPPHSLEAEQSLIGSLVINNEAWYDIIDIVSETDFYARSNRLLFKTIGLIIEERKPADLLTIEVALEDAKIIDDVGGFIYLAEIIKNTPSASNIKAYAEVVRDKATVRNVIKVGNEISEAGFDLQGRNSEQLLDFAESKVFNITQERQVNDEDPEHITEMLESAVDKLEQLTQTDNDGITGVRSGFTELDLLTTGFQGGDLIIVAARPSMGKTTFAMNCAAQASHNPEKPALVFSIEMPKAQILERLFASTGRINQTNIRTGQLNDAEWGKLAIALEQVSTMNLLIDDKSTLTPNEIKAKARRMYRKHGGLSMIMVDYLQLMNSPQFSDNKNLEISDISRSLKALAKELNVPVIALSQLNRDLEKRGNKRPINSDLRDSGAIEQDADLIIFLYRDEIYHDDSQYKGIAEVIIGKQRNGPLGRIPLEFHGQYSSFDNCEHTVRLEED